MGYRVIQWATGAMGKACLRAVIDHPDLELAGVYVHSAAKAGRDAGEIARRATTGVIATRDIRAILATEADVVIHAARIRFPYDAHKADICRLLASGKNVISINGHSYPAYHGLAYLREFEDACRAGSSTLFCTGLNPGFVDTLPGYDGYHHWTVELRGKPGLDITIDLVEPEGTGTRTKAVQYGVAGSVINAIPEVCAAPPGVLELPVFAPYRTRFSPPARAEPPVESEAPS